MKSERDHSGLPLASVDVNSRFKPLRGFNEELTGWPGMHHNAIVHHRLAGREERRLNTIQVDGCEYLSEAGNGYRVMARWCGPHAFETVARKDDQVVGSGRYEVSADGRTLTVSGDQLLIVLDRVENAGGPS